MQICMTQTIGSPGFPVRFTASGILRYELTFLSVLHSCHLGKELCSFLVYGMSSEVVHPVL